MGDMPPKTLLAVPCPTCGVVAGMPCLLHSGRLRNDPHIDRKLDAIEAVETKRIPRSGDNYPLDQNNLKYVGARKEKYDYKNDEQ